MDTVLRRCGEQSRFVTPYEKWHLQSLGRQSRPQPDTLYTYVTGNTWEELYPIKMSEVVFVNAEARCGQTVWGDLTRHRRRNRHFPLYRRESLGIERRGRLFEDKFVIVTWVTSAYVLNL